MTERPVIWAAAATLVNAGINDVTVNTATTARKMFFFNVFIGFGYFLILFCGLMVLS